MFRRAIRWLRREDAIQAAKSDGYNKATREAAITLVEYMKRGGRIVITDEAFRLNTVTLGLDWVIIVPETPAIFYAMDKAMYSVEKRQEFNNS